jgi:protein tyrosine phosphatase
MLKETKSVILRRLMEDKLVIFYFKLLKLVLRYAFRFQDKVMSVTEFLELMRRKNRENSLTNIIPQINNSVKNDTRSTSENQYINIVFIIEEKLVTTVKRRYESQVSIFE